MKEQRPFLSPLPLLLTATLLFTGMACGGGGGGGGSIALDDLGDEVADVLCKEAVECGAFPSEQACRDTLTIDQGQIIADVEAGLVEYNGDKARECLNSVDFSVCNQLSNDTTEPAACDETFVGSITLGGACHSSEACAGDAYCEGRSAEACSAGTCVARDARPTAGQNCANQPCADGLRCNDDQICAARTAAGAACTRINECVSGYVCELGVDQTPGTCIALADTGGSCNPEIGGTFFHACLKSGDFCDATDSTCKARLAVGASCATEELSNACLIYAECIDGSCESEILIGETCVVDGPGPGCIGGTDCVGGVCAAEPVDMVCSL